MDNWRVSKACPQQITLAIGSPQKKEIPNLLFLTLFKQPLTPPPLFLNIYVADYIADYSAQKYTKSATKILNMEGVPKC